MNNFAIIFGQSVTRTILFIVFCALTISIVRADDFDKIKSQIAQRQTSIDAMKSSGTATEGGDGLLIVQPGSDQQSQATINAENEDRNNLFDIISHRTGVSRDDVVSTFVRMAAGKGAAQAQNPPSSSPDQNSPSGPIPPAASPSTVSTPPPPVTPAAPSQPSSSETPPATSPPNHAALPLKVITRPFAKIYADSSTSSSVKLDNVPAFTIFYVIGQQEGWYQVSTKEGGDSQGWMSADDVAEWKHNLVVEYAHPDGRHPVLMFADKDKLKQMVELAQPNRIDQAKALYQAIDSNNIPQGFPVAAVEPKQAVDSKRQFYLLPIVDFDTSSDFRDADGNPLGREPRLLRLAAMTRTRGSHAVTASPGSDSQGDGTRKLKVDLVFVMDLTLSMGKWVGPTVKMIQKTVDILHNEDGMQFGFCAYRDDPVKCPGIGFLTKNYTPTLLGAQDFLPVLQTAEETKVDSIDYEEDVLSGVHDAVENTAWRPDALHFLVLVGDAPGREPNELDPDPYHDNWDSPPVGTACGMNADSIRRLADDKKIYLFPIYLSNPKWTKYDDVARTQWGKLGENRNLQASGNSAFIMIPGGQDTSIYDRTAETLGDRILAYFQQARGGSLNLPDQPFKPTSAKITTPDEANVTTMEVADNMFRGAFVDWLGDNSTTAKAPIPSDVTAWAVDKDFQDPAVQSLEVKVFLTKNQLDSLSKAVDHVLNAMARQQTDSEDFFAALQAVSAYSQARPDQMQAPDTLAKSGLVPAFITELPYRSQILSMNSDDWKNLTAQEVARIRDGLDSKLKFYREFHDNSSRWQALNSGDDPDKWVAAIPLDQLP